MNTWVEKTILLVKKRNYLDRLQLIYSHEEGERDVSTETIKKIKADFKKKDNTELLDSLLSLDKSPYKDSFVALLRKD